MMEEIKETGEVKAETQKSDTQGENLFHVMRSAEKNAHDLSMKEIEKAKEEQKSARMAKREKRVAAGLAPAERKIVEVHKDKDMDDKDKNIVKISGKIVGKSQYERATVLVIMTGKQYAGAVPNFPRIFCYREAKKQADSFEKESEVTIIAHIEPHFRPASPATDKRPAVAAHYEQILSADSIEAQGYMLGDFNVEGGVHKNSENKMNLCGTVKSIEMNRNSIINLMLLVNTDGHRNTIKVVYFAHGKSEVADAVTSLTPGSRIMAVGEIQTQRKEWNGPVTGKMHPGSTINYQNAVVFSVARIV